MGDAFEPAANADGLRSGAGLLRPAQSEGRARLLKGMAHAVAARGYAATTVTDIVREAAVSRRTFYEHFPDKASCMACLLETVGDASMQVLQAAIDPELPWPAQLHQAFTAYFQALAAEPVLLQVLYVESLGFGRAGLAVRRNVDREIARIVLQVMNGGREEDALLPSEMALALVGAIDSLVLARLEGGRACDLPEVSALAVELARFFTAASELH